MSHDFETVIMQIDTNYHVYSCDYSILCKLLVSAVPQKELKMSK